MAEFDQSSSANPWSSFLHQPRWGVSLSHRMKCLGLQAQAQNSFQLERSEVDLGYVGPIFSPCLQEAQKHMMLFSDDG